MDEWKDEWMDGWMNDDLHLFKSFKDFSLLDTQWMDEWLISVKDMCGGSHNHGVVIFF
jgi:hypothetical protein